ncbi:MAG: hypothetical protein KBS59_00410 [Clostridiales bacterium]|nr:hypothetical protein [Clostridiales bacterium]
MYSKNYISGDNEPIKVPSDYGGNAVFERDMPLPPKIEPESAAPPSAQKQTSIPDGISKDDMILLAAAVYATFFGKDDLICIGVLVLSILL